jgi:hypothetical protein
MLDKVASSPAGRTLLAVILLLVILAPIGYSVFTRVTAKGAESPERPDSKYTECIRDIEYMRFHHWELLKGLREKVVRDGIRGDLVDVETISGGEKKTIKVEQSLDGCWLCHQSKARFCDRCHDAATVRPDCFRCHYYLELDESVLER